MNRAHARIAVYLSKLRHDEIAVESDIDEKAQFVEKIQTEQPRHYIAMMHVALQGLARLECKIKVLHYKLDLILDALNNFKHLCRVLILVSIRVCIGVGAGPIRSPA